MSLSLERAERYVMGEGEPYLRNLAVLWAADARLARAVESIEGGYVTEPTRSGEVTVAVTGAGGTPVYVHSRYAPSEEARRLVERTPVGEAVVIYYLGLGLGYHLEALFEKASDEAVHVVFEPDLKMLRTCMEARDFSRLIESGRVYFFTAADKAEVMRRLELQFSLISLGAVTVVHPPTRQLRADFVAECEALIRDLSAYVKTAMATVVYNGRRTAENVARNVGWYAANAGVGRLEGLYKGKPAIVVSAGPSLRKNRELLKDACRGAVMIAVQTTLQPLVEMGIEPDFVTSLDYHEICSRFFEKLPPTLRTELVAEAKATDVIFDLHPGPLSLVGNEYAEKLLKEMAPGKARVREGATVAHLAYYLAEHLGCDPIIFVGQDLGFSDGLCYAPGTSYEDVWRPELSRFCSVEMKQWEQIARDRAILKRVPDYLGRPMYSEERLLSYLHQFEKDFASSPATIVDATEGGVYKRGTAAMGLAEALQRYCGRPVERVHLEAAMDWGVLAKCVECLEARRREAEQVEKIGRETLPLLEEVHDHVGQHGRVNRAIARIDALRARMNGLGACYELITELTQSTEIQRFRADRMIKAAKVSGEELQRRQVRRDIDNARAVADAAREFLAVIDDAIARLKDLARRKGVAA